MLAMSASTRVQDRQRSFKKGIDSNVIRRRREDTAIQIRKTLREDRLNQRRRMSLVTEETAEADASMAATGQQTARTQSLNGVSVSDLPKITAMIQSLDLLEQTTAVSKLRQLLSLEDSPPIQEVINLGVVPLLVGFLSRYDKPELQFEAAWALTNIASGTTDHTHAVVASGAVPQLCSLLLSTNDDVCEQAVWALGNISGDSPQYRDVVLNAGAMTPLLAVLRRSANKASILRNATWTLSNFCRGKPKPETYLVLPALTLLPHLIYSPDDEVITDACWTLSYLSDGPIENVQAVLDAGVCRRIVELVGHPQPSIQTPALRTVGNIVTGNEQQTQAALDAGVLAQLVPLLKHQKKLIRKEACWTISNITAGTRGQIQDVIDANVIPPLLQQLASEEFDVKKEAAWAISNATSGGSTEQIRYLVLEGCIPPVVKLLESQDARVVNVALDALENILKAGEAAMSLDSIENEMVRLIEEAEGIELIQNLQYHREEDIYEKALSLIRDYFDGEDEDDLELTTPEPDAASRQFCFGVGAGAAPSATNSFFSF